MTIFAGVMFHDPRSPVPTDMAKELAAHLSRAGDRPVQIAHPGFHFAYIDLGVHPGEPALHERDGGFAFVSGDPLLDVPNRAESRTREDDLPLIHRALQSGRDEVLRLAREAYCTVSYDPALRRLALVTDKVGARPIYVHSNERFVFFCSHFRILESVGFVERQIDPDGLAAAAAFNTLVGSILPFKGAYRLHACETVTFEDGQQRRHRYWSWANIATRHRPIDDVAREAAEIVRESVRLRLRGDRDAVLFLSGGLDSRLIAACLQEAGAEVRGYNFAPADTTDQVFARIFAQAAGLRHAEHPVPKGTAYPNWSMLLSDALASETGRRRAARAWHGFDASVTVGYVHMQDPLVPLLRERRFDAAVDEYIRRRDLGWKGNERVLAPRFSTRMIGNLKNVIWSALCDQMPEDPGKAMLIFHMEHGAPPLYTSDMEDVDLHCVDWVTPLADFRLTELMLSVDPVQCVGHAFYMKMLEHLPTIVTSVPWQTYPGHVPCPLPAPAIPTQWERSPEARRFAFRRADGILRGILRGPLSTDIIRPIGLARIVAQHLTRMTNCEWHFKRIAQLQRYLRASTPARRPTASTTEPGFRAEGRAIPEAIASTVNAPRAVNSAEHR